MNISDDKQAEPEPVTTLDDLNRQLGELRETTRVWQKKEDELRSDKKAFETKRKLHEQQGQDIAAESIELAKRSDECEDLNSDIFFTYNELTIKRRKQSETCPAVLFQNSHPLCCATNE
jgi:hypothetical protein